MIQRGADPDTFLVDFAKAKRRRPTRLPELLGEIFARAPAAVSVDGDAIAQAVLATMDACDFADPGGRPWLWNHYTLLLSLPDYDRLKSVEDELRAEIVTMLHTQMVERGVRVPDSIVVRWAPDDEAAVPPGRGVIRARRVKNLAEVAPVVGEVTSRADRVVKPTAPRPDSTEREHARVVSKLGQVGLPDGARRVLGREARGAGEDQVGLPGTRDNTKLSRRQVGILVRGREAEFTREPNANPVEVGGRALAEGESVTVALPVELVLSNGQWRGTVTC